MRGAFILSKKYQKNTTTERRRVKEERDWKQDTASAGHRMGYGQKPQWCCAREGHRMWDWSHLRGNGKIYSAEAPTDMNGGEQHGHSCVRPHPTIYKKIFWLFGGFVGLCCIFCLFVLVFHPLFPYSWVLGTPVSLGGWNPRSWCTSLRSTLIWMENLMATQRLTVSYEQLNVKMALGFTLLGHQSRAVLPHLHPKSLEYHQALCSR